MGIHLAHQVDNILRGDNGVEQAHLLSAVASVAVQDRDSVTVLTYIRLYHRFRLLRCHLKRYPLIPMIKAVNGLCGNELKHNGIARVFPAKEITEHTKHSCVKGKYILPDGLSQTV